MDIQVKQEPAKRFEYIDMLKGLGIFLVVYAHVITFHSSIENSGVLVQLIYMFHMPLFFFLTGFLSSVRHNYKSFFLEKFRQLIIPYFVYFLIVFVVQRYTSKNAIGLFSALVYGGRYLYGHLGVFWFVPCLFLTQQIANFILSRFSKNVIVLLWVLIFLILSYLNSQFYATIKFPYDINVVLAAIPFYCVGHLIRTRFEKRLVAAAIIFAVSGVTLIVLGYPNFYNMKEVNYGIPVLTFASSIAMIIVLLGIFMRLPSWKFLADLGKASLVIMYLHQPVQILLNEYVTSNVVVRIFAGVFFALILFYIFEKWTVTRALFLGSKNDLSALKLQGGKAALPRISGNTD